MMQKMIKRNVQRMLEGRDPAHDFQHIMRVYKNAKLIGRREGANMEVLLLAVLLHDIVVYPKGSAKSSRSSDDSADLAENILQSYGYSQYKINRISYCIRLHSYSKRLVPASLEGRILQDADRLDSLGAIGIARTFSVGGSEKRMFYKADDPFCRSSRELDDRQWTLDHFQTKLLKLKNLMHTRTAKKIAQERMRFMMLFIRQLQKEII
ncbi:MAG: HD domain-containing protein [Thermoproteota archaeon]|nr:HD domain-containing protein [Thermoproteota archaeon]